jgi:hypothetical protein
MPASTKPPDVIFPLLGFHDVGSLFASVEAIFEKRAKNSALLVEVAEESANMPVLAKTAVGTPHGTAARRHV